MKFASIDIGTNTILLLLAEADYCAPLNIYNDINYYEMPRLGKGLLPGEPVNIKRINLMRQVLTNYRERIISYGCDKILVNATNAFRIASNSSELSDIVEEILGVRPNIIKGTDEAYLSHLGAVSPRISGNEKGAVIDIGGGSTEITIGTKTKIEFSHSFDFGVVSLSEKYFKGIIPHTDEIKSLRGEVRGKLCDFPNIRVRKIVAVAGTPTSLSAIKQNLIEYRDELIEGSVLSKTDLRNLYNKLKSSSSAELIKRYPNILSGREDLIFSGLLILEEIIQKLGSNELIVSSRGLRYGAITHHLLKTENRNNNRQSE
ncbi:MAG: phosphatase [Melioribacteraceae bacterium]|nr:MAG: phosphatase [Melioribacteraceae bacterium]